MKGYAKAKSEIANTYNDLNKRCIKVKSTLSLKENNLRATYSILYREKCFTDLLFGNIFSIR